VTDEPAPDRQAPIRRRLGRISISRVSWGKTFARYCSWRAIDRHDAKQVELPGRHPGDAERDPGEVGDGVGREETLAAAPFSSPPSTGAAPDVETARRSRGRVEPERLDPVPSISAADDEPP